MSKISTQVMGAVALIYTARALLSATALKLYVLLASVWAVAKLVWVARVLQNLATVEKSGIASVLNFMLEAVTHAHPGVQVTLFVAALALISLFFDFRGAAARGARLAA
jgi:hypothetical protein